MMLQWMCDETDVKRNGRNVTGDVQYEVVVWSIKIHRVHRQGKNHDVSLKHWDVTETAKCHVICRLHLNLLFVNRVFSLN